MCGSCAMTVNGRPRWTCRTHISKVVEDGRVEIGPLANLPVIKDLACDMAALLREVAEGQGRVRAEQDRGTTPIERISPASAPRIAADAAIECINCAVCYSACDTVRWNEDYLGPAALNRAWTLVNDVRDAGNTRAARALSRRTAAATPATRTRAARSTAPRRSTPPPPSPASSGARCRPISGASCDVAMRDATWCPSPPCGEGVDATCAGGHSEQLEPRTMRSWTHPTPNPSPSRGGESARRHAARADQPMNVRLYILQRATAAIMAPLVLAHLVVIYYATSRGLSAAEILGRTRGSIGWGAFYALFVLAAAMHGAIGVRAIASEWTRLRGSARSTR